MLETEIRVCRLIGKQHAVIEGILAVSVMPQYDVGQFVRQYCGQTGFIRQHVDQPSADHNRIADAECLERGCKQHASTNRRRQYEVVSDLQVIDYGLQDIVDISFRGCESRPLKAFQYIVCCLLLPLPFSLKGRGVLGRRAFVLHGRIHPHLRELVLFPALHVVPPKSTLGSKGDVVLGTAPKVTLFAVDVSWNPVTRNQVQTPASHVKEVAISRTRCIGAVQPDDVEIPVFYPNPTEKTALACILPRRHVKYQAPHLSQELTVVISEVVVLAVEIIPIGKDHPGKS